MGSLALARKRLPTGHFLLLRCGDKARAFHRFHHLLYSHDALLIGDASELVFETHLCVCDALQPFQGLLDHEGSGPSRHTVNPQIRDGGL